MAEESLPQQRQRMNRRPSLGVQVRTPSQRNLDGAVLMKQPSEENLTRVQSGTTIQKRGNPGMPQARRSSLSGSQSMMLRRNSSAGFPPRTQVRRGSLTTTAMTGSEHSRWDNIFDGNEEQLSQGMNGNMDWNAEYLAQAAKKRSSIDSLPGSQSSYTTLNSIKRTMGMDGSSHSGMGMSSRSRNLLLVQAQADSPVANRRKSLEMVNALEKASTEPIQNSNEIIVPPAPLPNPNLLPVLNPQLEKQLTNPFHNSSSMRSLHSSGVSSKSLVVEDTGQMQIQMPQVAFFNKQISSSTLQTETQSTSESKQTQQDIKNSSSSNKLQQTMDRLNAEVGDKQDGQPSLQSSRMSRSGQSVSSSLQRKMDRLNAEAMGSKPGRGLSGTRSIASRGSFRSRRTARNKHDDDQSEASLLMGFVTNRTEYLQHADQESSVAPTEHEEAEVEETDEESLFEDFNPELRKRGSNEHREPIKMVEEEFDSRRPWRKQLDILPTIPGHAGEMSEYSAVGTDFNQTKETLIERKETDSDITDIKSTSDIFELIEAKGALERMGYTGLLPDDHSEPESETALPLPPYSHTLSSADTTAANMPEMKINETDPHQNGQPSTRDNSKGAFSPLATDEGKSLENVQNNTDERHMSSTDLAKTAAAIGIELTMLQSPTEDDHTRPKSVEISDLKKVDASQGSTEEIFVNGTIATEKTTEVAGKEGRTEEKSNNRLESEKDRREIKEKNGLDKSSSKRRNPPGNHKGGKNGVLSPKAKIDGDRSDDEQQTEKEDGHLKKDTHKNKNRRKRSNSSERRKALKKSDTPPSLIEDNSSTEASSLQKASENKVHHSHAKTSPTHRTDDYDEEEARDQFHGSFNYDSGSSSLDYDWSTHEKKWSDRSLGSSPSVHSGGTNFSSSRSSRGKKASQMHPTLDKIGEDEEVAPPVVPNEKKPKKKERRRLSLRSSFQLSASKEPVPEGENRKDFNSAWTRFSYSSFTSRSHRAGAVLEGFSEREKKGIEGFVGPFIWKHRLKVLIAILVSIFVLCLSIPLANRSSDQKSVDDQLTDGAGFPSTTPTLAPSIMPSYAASPATLLYSKIQTISGSLPSDTAGSSVAFSSNGSFLAVGFRDAHKVRVFKLIEGDQWEKVGPDIEGLGDGDNFGTAISISNDGMRLAIGAPYAGEDDHRGYTRVLQYSSNAWDQLGDTIFGSEEVSYAGFSVSISGNGERLAIGEPKAGSNTGLVRIFKLDLFSGVWVQIGQTLVGVGETDFFGFSLGMSQTGDIVAIGVLRSQVNELKNAGRVKIYQLDETITGGETWDLLGSDIVGESAGDLSGYSLALTPSGSHIAIGSNGHDKLTESGEVKNVGSCRVFKFENQSWNQVGQTLEGEVEKEQSGASVAITKDGKRLACGAPFNSNLGEESGTVRIYQEKDEEWMMVGEPLSSRSEALFGKSLAFTVDGKFLAVGAPKTAIGGNQDIGQVFVYKSNV